MAEEELKEALWSIPGQKSPSPYGFRSYFYKDSKEIVGNDVTVAIMDFFNPGKLLKEVNNSILTLIPKLKCPSSVKYRPMACLL